MKAAQLDLNTVVAEVQWALPNRRWEVVVEGAGSGCRAEKSASVAAQNQMQLKMAARLWLLAGDRVRRLSLCLPQVASAALAREKAIAMAIIATGLTMVAVEEGRQAGNQVADHRLTQCH